MINLREIEKVTPSGNLFIRAARRRQAQVLTSTWWCVSAIGARALESRSKMTPLGAATNEPKVASMMQTTQVETGRYWLMYWST